MGVTTHAYGGTRMATTPRRTWSTAFGFAHDVPNLGILGASVMGTSARATRRSRRRRSAWRTAEHLAAQWSTIAG